MTRKFYHAENAGRVIAGQNFTVYGIFGGTAFGVLAVTDDQIGNDLDELMKSDKSITAIDEAEYTKAMQKKIPNFAPSIVSIPAKTKPEAIKGDGAVVVLDEPPAPSAVNVDKAVETVAEAIALGSVGQNDGQP